MFTYVYTVSAYTPGMYVYAQGMLLLHDSMTAALDSVTAAFDSAAGVSLTGCYGEPVAEQCQLQNLVAVQSLCCYSLYRERGGCAYTVPNLVSYC